MHYTRPMTNTEKANTVARTHVRGAMDRPKAQDVQYAVDYLMGNHHFLGMRNEVMHRSILISNGIDVDRMVYDFKFGA